MCRKDFFQIWISLEMRILVFIPFMLIKKNFFSVNSTLIYFIVQTLAGVFFFCGIIIPLKDFYWTILNLLIPFSLIFKLGIWPLFSWFPIISEIINWNRLIILTTWQKIIPLYIITYFSFLYFFFNFNNNWYFRNFRYMV